MKTNSEKPVYCSDKDMVLYYGYRIYRDGRIISPSGKEIQSYFFTYDFSHVSLKIGGKITKKNKAILIYNLFSDEPIDTRLFILRFKDGNFNNAAYDNLCLVSRKEHYRDCRQSGRGQHRFDLKTRQDIREEYEQGYKSLRQLCKKYRCSLMTMQKIVKSEV